MKYYYKILLTLAPVFLLAIGTQAQEVVASYPFDGNVKDASPYEQTTTVHAATLTADRFDVAQRAFHFDGEQAYIRAANGAHLQSGTMTAAFWVRVESLPGSGEVYLLSHGGWQERWKISLPNHGKLIFTTNASSGISDMDAGDGNELVPGEWTHVAMVHDGTNDRIFMNGVMVAEKEVAGDLNATTYPFGMGYNPVDGANFFNGDLDEVTLWDGALSESAIADLYAAQSTPPVFARGVVASYSFSGSLLDGSSFGNQASSTDGRFTTDRFGFGDAAFEFNGESTRVTASNSAQLNGDSTTVAFWVRVNELPGSGEAYIASFGGWQERWKISLPSHGKPVWTTNHENGISDMDSGDGNELVAGQWMHVAFVHDGQKDLIYMNGQLVAEKDVVGNLNDTEYPLGIGYNPIDDANFFDGKIDEFMVFNTAVSADDIMALYNQQNTGDFDPDNPMVLNLSFAGDTRDRSQFGNDAMNMGANQTYDRFGYAANAYVFDGSSSAMYADNSVQYNSDYTSISFWVNVIELPASGEDYILSHGGWQERWKISLPSHGKPVFTTNNDGGISDMDSGDGNELVPGEWTHVVMVHGDTSDYIYINGELANEKEVGGVMNKTGYPFGVGFNPIDQANYFNGLLDEIRLYNRELTAQEVSDLYDVQVEEPIFTEELVAYYKMNWNANDETVFKNHGMVNGATVARDRFGRANYAFGFNGESDYISAANSPQLNSPLTTVSFWVNVNELPATGEAYLLTFGGWQERWKISLPSHGKPVWTTNNTSGISDMDSGDGNELVPGEWTHVVMVHDGAQDLIYFDGELVAEKDVAGDMNETTFPFGMGFNIIDGGSYFDGSLDDVQVYNVALTAQQIADLYAEQSADPMDPDVTAPDAPLGLTGTAVNTTVHLSWLESTDEESGLAAYNVYVDSALTMTTRDNAASVADLVPMTEYRFGVTALDSAGNESNMSSINVTTGLDATPDTIPPTTPANLAIDAASNSVVFSWDASFDDGGVAGYIVFVDGFLFDTVPGTETSVFIGNLDPETLYTFEVQAFDNSGNISGIADITESTDPPVNTGEEGLVAHYPFEGNANDATPYENHGEIGGDPIFEDVEDRPNASGQAIVFDGMRDSVLAPNAPQLISDYTTVSFWIRVDDQNLNDAEAYILDFGHWDQRWKISLPQHLKIVWTTNSDNMISENFISDMDAGDGNELVIGFWWYVTMVHDGENDIIYIDGVETNSIPVEGTLNSTGRPLGFGNNPIDGGQYFIGALDEVKIYNKALTAGEVEKLYNTGTTGVPYFNDELYKYLYIVYPNPSSDELHIRHRFDPGDELLIRIFDRAGRQVSHLRVDRLQAGDLSLDIGDLDAGAYSLNFVLEGQNLGSIPFIKQ